MSTWSGLKKSKLGYMLSGVGLLVTLPILLILLIGLLVVFAPSLIPPGVRYLIPIKRKWKKQTTPQLQAAVKKAAKELSVNPNSIMTVFKIESNFNTQAVNPVTQATGLWQVLPSTARDIGISALKTYSTEKQVEEFVKYVNRTRQKFKPWPASDQTDLYLAIFYPAAVGKEDFQFPSVVGTFNPLFKGKGGVVSYKSISDYLDTKA